MVGFSDGTRIQLVSSIDPATGNAVDFSAPAAVIGTVADGSTDDNTPPVKSGGLYSNPTPTYSAGQVATFHFGIRGAAHMQIMSSDGTAGAQVGTTARGASLTTNRLSVRSALEVSNGTTLDTKVKPNRNGRLLSSAATTNATSVRAASTDLLRVAGYSARASACFLKIYDKASAPTVGTDTPVLTLYIPPTAAFSFALDEFYLANGLAYAITGAAADNDTTAVAAGDVLCLNLTHT